MAKSMASMSMAVAIWLIVLLAIITRMTYSKQGWSSVFGSDSARMKKLEAKLPNLNEKELHELGTLYAKMLRKKSNFMSYDEVSSTLVKLHDLDTKYDNFYLTEIDLSDSWKELLPLRASVDECSSNIHKVSAYASTANVNEHQHQFAFQCLRDYLEKCGLEERFKEIIGSIKQKSRHRNSYTFPTFFSYLEAEFWPRKSLKSKLHLLLSAVKQLPALENISRESDCPSKLTTKLLYWKAHIKECRNLFSDYFALYLEACGYEKRFKKIIDSIDDAAEKSQFSATHSTMNKYFKKEFFTKVRPDEEFIRKELVNLLSVIKKFTDTADCSKESRDKLIDSLFDESRPSNRLEQIYYAQYLKNCGFERSFKRAIDNKQASHELWDSVTYPTFYSYFRQRSWNQIELEQMLSAIEDFSSVEGISEETDCTGKLKVNLVHGLATSNNYPDLKKLMESYFVRFVQKCGYEERFTRVKMQHKILANENNLMSYYLKKSWVSADDLLFTLNVIEKLADFSQNDGHNCNKNFTMFIHGSRFGTKEAAGDALKRDIERIFHDYKKGCTNHFKLMAEKFKQDNAEKWALIERSTSLIDSKLSFHFRLNPDEVLQTFILPEVAQQFDGSSQSGIAGVEKREKFIEKLKADCQSLLDYMDQDLFTMSYDYVFVLEAKYDDDIKKFMEYLSCCSRINSRSDAKLESMFSELGMPFYPEEVDLSWPRRGHEKEEKKYTPADVDPYRYESFFKEKYRRL